MELHDEKQIEILMHLLLTHLIDGGTAFKEALQGIIILGKVISAKVIPATRGVDLGN